MRTTPYPQPPSRTWSVTMVGTYAALALAGAIVLFVLATSAQPLEGVLVLGLWGGLSLLSSLACLYGVARDRYRWEWLGTWGIVAGTSVYVAVTVLGLVGLSVLLLLVLMLAVAVGGLTVAVRSRFWLLWAPFTALTVAGIGAVVVTSLGDALGVFLTSLPTILVFVYAVGRTLGRAIQLSLIDMQARRQVLAEAITGEIPEVRPSE